MNKLETALTATNIPFAHFGFVNAPKDAYMVWSENMIDSFRAGGFQAETITHGTLDLFTRDDTQTQRLKVEKELNKIDGFAFALESIQYEEETGFIHFEWYWSMQ